MELTLLGGWRKTRAPVPTFPLRLSLHSELDIVTHDLSPPIRPSERPPSVLLRKESEPRTQRSGVSGMNRAAHAAQRSKRQSDQDTAYSAALRARLRRCAAC